MLDNIDVVEARQHEVSKLIDFSLRDNSEVVYLKVP